MTSILGRHRDGERRIPDAPDRKPEPTNHPPARDAVEAALGRLVDAILPDPRGGRRRRANGGGEGRT